MRIEQLTLHTAQLAELRRFYTETLELPLVAENPEWFSVQAGNTRLTFRGGLEARQMIPGGLTRPHYHFAFNIPSSQFAEGKAWLAERVPLLTDDTGQDEFYFGFWKSHAVYFVDPAGNIGELIARPEIVVEDAPPFSADSLLEVSEIGVVCENLPATRALVEEKLGLQVYGGAAMDGFAAMGDALGLFIMVDEGRGWWPDTARRAEVHPLEAVLSVDGRTVRWAGPPYAFTG